MHIALITAVAGITEATIPYNQGDAVGSWLIIKALVVTACLLTVTYGVLLVLKRKNLLPRYASKKATLLEVVESRQLSARTTIHLVRAGGEMTLISESSGHVAMKPLSGAETQP